MMVEKGDTVVANWAMRCFWWSYY